MLSEVPVMLSKGFTMLSEAPLATILSEGHTMLSKEPSDYVLPCFQKTLPCY